MRRIMNAVEKKAAEFAQAPLFEWMRDTSIDPRRRLAFVPCLAHFVMTFADLYALVFREEPPGDDIQEIVNVHTREDGDHWKWFLIDLERLGLDPELPFSQALKLVWSDATVQTRMLSYHMCRLGLRADSLRKLVLVQCIEATGRVSLQHAAQVGSDFSALTGKKLIYFGAHHFDTEADHTLEADDVRRRIGDIRLSPDQARELSSLVDECFGLFASFTDELLAHALRGRRTPIPDPC